MYVVCSVSYSVLTPLNKSFCTEGLHGVAESISILWLFLMVSATSPTAARRMTALLELSKFQMGMKGEFSPALLQQILR